MNDRIEAVKAKADAEAERQAKVCIGYLLRNPMTALAAASVTPNYKHFRRLAGLGGRDLRRIEP